MQSAAIPHPSDAERLLGQLAADSAALLRCEIELSAAERVPELRRQALDGAQAALAVVCLLLAAAALSWAAVVSMSNVKYDAIVAAGIGVDARIRIPDALVPADARVEIDAKVAAGYFSDGAVPDQQALASTKGRTY